MCCIITAATGPAICIILASYSGCDRNAAMAYFVLSMALMAGFYPGMKVSRYSSYRQSVSPNVRIFRPPKGLCLG